VRYVQGEHGGRSELNYRANVDSPLKAARMGCVGVIVRVRVGAGGCGWVLVGAGL